MKIFLNILLALLVLLAAFSGVAKIMLAPQEVDFFGQFGFTNPILIGFGVIQLLGGAMLAFPKTRRIGATVVAITFLISAAILAMAGNIPMAAITLIFTLLLGYVVKKLQ